MVKKKDVGGGCSTPGGQQVQGWLVGGGDGANGADAAAPGGGINPLRGVMVGDGF